jgi:hypothetical protein
MLHLEGPFSGVLAICEVRMHFNKLSDPYETQFSLENFNAFYELVV